MAKYRKKPVIVEAEEYRPGLEDGWYCKLQGCENLDQCDIICGAKLKRNYNCPYFTPYIKTLEGKLEISKGDYIITGVKGERYPIKPDIFRESYEPVDDGEIDTTKELLKRVFYAYLRFDRAINTKPINREELDIAYTWLDAVMAEIREVVLDETYKKSRSD